MIAPAIVALGSNIQPETNLPLAVARLRPLGAQAVSRAYQNRALGDRSQPDFINAAALLETAQGPSALRAALRQIEADLGRQRTADKYAPRTIDLDLLLLGDQIVDGPEWWLPDPGLLELAHLAVPAAEIAPDVIHPMSGETLQGVADRLRPSAELRPRPDVSEMLQRSLQREGTGS